MNRLINKVPPIWMALVLDTAAETITVAAFNESKEQAESDAREQTAADAPILCVNITGNAKGMANRISLGELDVPELPVKGGDEIADLAGAFNRMRKGTGEVSATARSCDVTRGFVRTTLSGEREGRRRCQIFFLKKERKITGIEN